MSYYQIGYMAYVAGFSGYYLLGHLHKVYPGKEFTPISEEICQGWEAAWDQAHND